ncbi:hypothetical protein PSAC2689_120035 [Paraburkholderia sacchari]
MCAEGWAQEPRAQPWKPHVRRRREPTAPMVADASSAPEPGRLDRDAPVSHNDSFTGAGVTPLRPAAVHRRPCDAGVREIASY